MSQDIAINFSDYKATVRTNGGGLSSLTFKGRNLVEPFNEFDTRPLFRGDLLAPWPNRIADGHYKFENISFNLEINETSRKNALHGLLLKLEWEVVKVTSDTVSLISNTQANNLYLSDLQFTVTYTLSLKGLEWQLVAHNKGTKNVPYGVSIHPYLIADPASQLDKWSLKLPASQSMNVDEEGLLPLGIEDVDQADFNFNKSRIIGSQFIDHAFKINKNSSNQVIEVVAPSGKGVAIKYGSEALWIQIHTADRDGGENSREALAVEPMTCPPDAFNSGIDLIVLKPGESHCATWYIEGIE